MAQAHFWVHLVAVARADAVACDVAGLAEVPDEGLRRAFGDPGAGGDVAQARSLIAGDADEDDGVVGEKGPALLREGPSSNDPRCGDVLEGAVACA